MKYKLGELCDVVSGGTPSRAITEFWEGGTIPWIKIGNIKGKYVGEVDEYITQAGLEGSSAKTLSAGTILFTIFATLGEVGILTIKACTNQAIAGITIKNQSEVLTDYLYYFLKSKKSHVTALGRGVAQNNINLSILRNFEVPIPALSTQKQIVDVLDKAEKIIEARQQQFQKLDELVKARFVEMFGIPGTDTFGWGLVPLGSACNINPKKNYDSRLVSGVEVSFVPMPAVTERGEIDATAIKEYDEVKTGFTYFTENDVLFAKITPCMENGKGAVAKGLHNGIGFGSTEFHVLRPISGKADPYWIYTLTAFSQFRMDAASNMTGSAGQRRVPASFLENYRVSLPPIELQEQFAAFVEQTDKSKVAVQKALDKAQLLFDSLMQKYFG